MEFFLTDWAVWTPELTLDDASLIAAPELTQVPAMTRRRLSKLTKLTFDVALQLQASDNTPAAQQQLSTIFASRHGDLHKTLGLLQQVAQQEELSPTQFALSVHNAIIGQLSLFSQNRADSNAIAAGADSLHYAVLEAAARLQTEADLDQVLVLYADEPVPQVYQPFCRDPAQPVALALLLSRSQGEKVCFSRHSAPAQQASEQQTLQLLPWLQQQCHAVSIAGRQCQWQWQRG
ncbi:MAG: beta-ketoacyl synthase chain length factor [Gammaproteobacteria bacterium]|nr:beta-ketoacyl synthase chain length factor [Gammaproteobacteria bacterium]MBU1553589.1 beta-ketoacyl synthase chain length factor [Gammaproteobacteria bacterium]MBU2070587.1 beta-ketoacyl synthase chain length factor [Gammaproteobacteria bacterium]MBU2181991.1 beta-ketoacyl synthase chain length factor [Gammaproteobacteria bacterium]MBU2207093.1 beta-ketoacyl synthase chain length factor [Gammaproteobacteria bacterium]